MIKCHNLTVKVKNKILLDNVSFSPAQGKITAVLGPNGSGKTTLLRTLSGNTGHYQGEVYVNDVDIKVILEKQLAHIISYMPQVLPRPSVTAREMISFSRFSHLGKGGILSPSDWEIVDDAIAKTGLWDKQYTEVCHLSGGERQMTCFAMIMAQQRQVLILDEPSQGLDTNIKFLFYSLIKEIKSQGKTIIISMHDLNEACDIADEIVVLQKGKKIFTGTADEFKNSSLPADLFGLKIVNAQDENGTPLRIFINRNNIKID